MGVMGRQASKEYHTAYRKNNIENRRRWNREWIASHQDQYNASKYRYRNKIKLEGLMHYSGGDVRCAICGEVDMDVLCLDHINNDGAAQRKRTGISGRGSIGISTYAGLKREGWPDGLQVLCANCNMKKQMILHRRNRERNPFYESEVMPNGYHTTA